MAVSTALGDTPGAVTPDLPDGYSGYVRVLQFLAGLTADPVGDVSLVGWGHGTSFVDTRDDPDAVGSRTALSLNYTTREPASCTAHLTGATDTALAVLAVGASTGTYVARCDVGEGGETTGHPFFYVHAHPADSLWVTAVVTPDAAPPTITDDGGFTFTLLDQRPLGDGWLTLWSADLPDADADWITVTLSTEIDSAVGVVLTIPT